MVYFTGILHIPFDRGFDFLELTSLMCDVRLNHVVYA